jgi:phosphoribosyl 1,2-cyclic phosphodiesterase
MARIYPLFSSSKGNCYFCETGDGGILIDCGKSYKQIKLALDNRGIPFSAVKTILITHTHSDHVSGLRVINAREQVKVFASGETLKRLDSSVQNAEVVSEKPFELPGSGGVFAEAIPTKHDCAGSCCYKLTFPSGGVCVFCTDLGVADKSVISRVVGAGTVFLESNYDPDMLRDCFYDYSTKARIASNSGHLSNTASARFAGELIKSGTKQIVLSHLSENSNTPELAKAAHLSVLKQEFGFTEGIDFLMSVLKPVCDEEYFAV